MDEDEDDEDGAEQRRGTSWPGADNRLGILGTKSGPRQTQLVCQVGDDASSGTLANGKSDIVLLQERLVCRSIGVYGGLQGLEICIYSVLIPEC